MGKSLWLFDSRGNAFAILRRLAREKLYLDFKLQPKKKKRRYLLLNIVARINYAKDKNITELWL